MSEEAAAGTKIVWRINAQKLPTNRRSAAFWEELSKHGERHHRSNGTSQAWGVEL